MWSPLSNVSCPYCHQSYTAGSSNVVPCQQELPPSLQRTSPLCLATACTSTPSSSLEHPPAPTPPRVIHPRRVPSKHHALYHHGVALTSPLHAFHRSPAIMRRLRRCVPPCARTVRARQPQRAPVLPLRLARRPRPYVSLQVIVATAPCTSIESVRW